MGAFMGGALHPFVCNATFFQAPYFPFIFYGLNIECYMQWKEKSTAMPLEVRTHLVPYALEIKGHRNAFPHQVGHFYLFSF
jgi:hypothetical protein